MADKIVTIVYVSESDDGVLEEIQDVMNGESDCAEFVGVDRRSGTEVTVRFQLAEAH